MELCIISAGLFGRMPDSPAFIEYCAVFEKEVMRCEKLQEKEYYVEW